MPDPDLLVPALAALAVLSPLAVLVRDRRRTVTPSTEAARALRHATLPAATATAVLLLGLLAVAMWVVFYQPFGGSFRPGGRALACMPLAAALAFLLVHAVGELTYPRPTGDVRTAVLTTRTAADVAPRRLRRTTSAWAAGLGVVLLVGTLTATGPRLVGAVLGILAVAVCVAGVVLALPRAAARPAATLTEAPA